MVIGSIEWCLFLINFENIQFYSLLEPSPHSTFDRAVHVVVFFEFDCTAGNNILIFPCLQVKMHRKMAVLLILVSMPQCP